MHFSTLEILLSVLQECKNLDGFWKFLKEAKKWNQFSQDEIQSE